MSPFEPAGEQARWRTIYALLRDTEVDSVLTYEEMATALGLDPVANRHLIQVSMRRAAKELEVVNNHAVTPVVNVGYRVVRAEEHLDLARRHQRKSSRALAVSRSKVTHVDWAALDPTTRTAFEVVAQALTAQISFNRRLDIRQQQLSEALAEVQREHEETRKRTSDELATIQERLAKLESQL